VIAAARGLNDLAPAADVRGVVPQLRPVPLTGDRPPAPPADSADQLRHRLRALPDGDHLLESMRRELVREYERGYHDGWASTKAPRPEMPRPHSSHRFGRRMRRRMRAMVSSTAALRRTLFQLVLIVGVTWLATFVGLHLSNTSHDAKFAPPPSNPK
jgi:hypothetical protein